MSKVSLNSLLNKMFGTHPKTKEDWLWIAEQLEKGGDLEIDLDKFAKPSTRLEEGK